jgi:hypothetical protein
MVTGDEGPGECLLSGHHHYGDWSKTVDLGGGRKRRIRTCSECDGVDIDIKVLGRPWASGESYECQKDGHEFGPWSDPEEIREDLLQRERVCRECGWRDVDEKRGSNRWLSGRSD